MLDSLPKFLLKVYCTVMVLLFLRYILIQHSFKIPKNISSRSDIVNIYENNDNFYPIALQLTKSEPFQTIYFSKKYYHCPLQILKTICSKDQPNFEVCQRTEQDQKNDLELFLPSQISPESWKIDSHSESDANELQEFNQLEYESQYSPMAVQDKEFWDYLFSFIQTLDEDEYPQFQEILSAFYSSTMIHISSKYQKGQKKIKYINFDYFFTKINKNYDEKIFELVQLLVILQNYFRGVYLSLTHYDYTNFLNSNSLSIALTTNLKKDLNQFYKEHSYNQMLQNVNSYLLNHQIDQIQPIFYNFNAIFNCMNCQQCGIYSKIILNGIETSLKLLREDLINPKNYSLSEYEFKSQIIAYTYFSEALALIEKIYEKRVLTAKNMIFIIGGAFGMLILFLSIAVKANSEMKNKIRQKFNHTMPPSVYKKAFDDDQQLLKKKQ